MIYKTPSLMFSRLSSDLATLVSVFGSLVSLQTIDLLVSITAGLIACVAGLWAIYDRWQKRKGKKAG